MSRVIRTPAGNAKRSGRRVHARTPKRSRAPSSAGGAQRRSTITFIELPNRLWVEVLRVLGGVLGLPPGEVVVWLLVTHPEVNARLLEGGMQGSAAIERIKEEPLSKRSK